MSNDLLKRFACQCCGYLTRSESMSGTFDICPVCNWEDDDVQCNDPDFEGGANTMSLNEARKHYKEFGAKSKEALIRARVRPPNPDEIL